jgi:thiosulfate/3-mercaptopyruvate sulfurtransferase
VPDPLAPIVAPEWLAARIAEGDDGITVADVRWYLDGRSGLDAYRAGHVPGAVWVDLDRVLADPPSSAAGRHPLPSPERFATGLGALGIGEGTVVVAYDDQGGMAAGRLVWLLRALGHPAALLDGDLAAWSEMTGGQLRSGDEARPATTLPVRPWPDALLASADETARAAARGGAVVLDARAPERYRGEVEPIDARPGHVPGARNAPFAANLDPSGRFRPPDELRHAFESVGVDFGVDVEGGSEVIVYCGSGVSACHDLLALEAAGLPPGRARLYPGSWSQWAADPDRPAALGDGT